jgi:ribosomal protein L21E
MLKWFIGLFRSKKKRTPQAIQTERNLQTIRTGDLVHVTLDTDFAAFALTQPSMRFSKLELETRSIKGVVAYCKRRPDYGNCYVVEIQTISETSYGIKGKSIAILQDEIEDIKKYED